MKTFYISSNGSGGTGGKVSENLGLSFKYAHKSFDLHQGKQQATNLKQVQHPSSLNSAGENNNLIYNISSSNKSGEPITKNPTP